MNTVLSRLVLRWVYLFVVVTSFTQFGTLACTPKLNSTPIVSVARGGVGGG